MLGVNKNTVTADLKKIRQAITAYLFEGDENIMEKKVKTLPIDATYERLYNEDYSKYCNVGNKPMFTQKGILNPLVWEDGNKEVSTVRKGKLIDGIIVWEDGRVEELDVVKSLTYLLRCHDRGEIS